MMSQSKMAEMMADFMADMNKITDESCMVPAEMMQGDAFSFNHLRAEHLQSGGLITLKAGDPQPDGELQTDLQIADGALGVGSAGAILLSTGGTGTVRWEIPTWEAPTVSLDNLSEEKIEQMVRESGWRLQLTNNFNDSVRSCIASQDAEASCRDPEASVFKGDSEQAMFPLDYVEHLEYDVLELENAFEDELSARIGLEEVLNDIADALRMPHYEDDIVEWAQKIRAALDRLEGADAPAGEAPAGDPALAYERAMKIVGR